MPASHFRNIVVLLSLHFPIRARPCGSHEGVGRVQRHLTRTRGPLQGGRQMQSIKAQQFGAQLRFFRQLCTAAKVPHIIALTRKALQEGHCVVIGLQSTGALTCCPRQAGVRTELDHRNHAS